MGALRFVSTSEAPNAGSSVRGLGEVASPARWRR